MVCANCDFSSPCACERKRLAAASFGGLSTPPLERLERDLAAALNTVASLLHHVDPALNVAVEAEELLRELRGRHA